MQDILFYIFAALTLACGFLVVANPLSRNPVTSAMFLVLTIISMSGLFILLQAFFLAAVQILVYAGAVIVLFLFVIMLLDLKATARRRYSQGAVGLSAVALGALGLLFVSALVASNPGADLPPPELKGETTSLGRALFTQYLLPVELIALLLLAAMIGVFLLSKREDKS